MTIGLCFLTELFRKIFVTRCRIRRREILYDRAVAVGRGGLFITRRFGIEPSRLCLAVSRDSLMIFGRFRSLKSRLQVSIVEKGMKKS